MLSPTSSPISAETIGRNRELSALVSLTSRNVSSAAKCYNHLPDKVGLASKVMATTTAIIGYTIARTSMHILKQKIRNNSGKLGRDLCIMAAKMGKSKEMIHTHLRGAIDDILTVEIMKEFIEDKGRTMSDYARELAVVDEERRSEIHERIRYMMFEFMQTLEGRSITLEDITAEGNGFNVSFCGFNGKGEPVLNRHKTIDAAKIREIHANNLIYQQSFNMLCAPFQP